MKKNVLVLFVLASLLLIVGCGQKVVKLNVEDGMHEMYLGEEYQIKYTVENSEEKVKITVSDESILTITDGIATSHAAGPVEIFLELENTQQKAVIEVNVWSPYEGIPSGDEVTITSYRGKKDIETLTIPETIYIRGSHLPPEDCYKKVVGIGENFLSDSLSKNLTIMNVEIPDSVLTIHKRAFYNNIHLKNVLFGANSNLKFIDEQAFFGTIAIEHFTIPSKVNHMGSEVFMGSSISQFETMNTENYEWINDLLINKNVSNPQSLIAVYANPFAEEIVVPSDVTLFESGLFKDNKYLKSIDLNQVTHLGYEAFSNSSLEVVINAENVISAEAADFKNTPFINNLTDEFIMVGSALLKYNGNSENLIIPEGVVHIGTNALEQTNLETIVLPKTLKTLGSNPSLKTLNLQWALFKSPSPPVLNSDTFLKDTSLYVQENSLTAYQNNIFFTDLKEQLKVKTVTITFLDQNDQLLETTEKAFGSYFVSDVTPPPVSGQKFLYWQDDEGNEYVPYSIFMSYENVILKPHYEIN